MKKPARKFTLTTAIQRRRALRRALRFAARFYPQEWEEEWSSACDSECPKCGTENIECDRYEDMNEEAEPLAVLPAAPYRYEEGKIIGPPMNAWGAGYVPATIVCQVTAGDAGTGGQYSHYPAEVATRHIEIMLAALNAQPLGTLPA